MLDDNRARVEDQFPTMPGQPIDLQRAVDTDWRDQKSGSVWVVGKGAGLIVAQVAHLRQAQCRRAHRVPGGPPPPGQTPVGEIQ